MKRKRNLSLFILITVLVLAGVAVYLGIYLQNQTTAPKNTNAANPTATCINLTTNKQGSKETTTVSYCPGGGVASSEIQISNASGELFFYCAENSACTQETSFYVNGTNIVSDLGSVTVKPSSAGITFQSGDVITLAVKDYDYQSKNRLQDYSVGWIPADDNNNCTSQEPATDTNSFSLTSVLNKITNTDHYIVLSKQCWADTPANDGGDFDFNDIGIVIAYLPPATPTPPPTSTPTMTPVPKSTSTPIPTSTPTKTLTPTPTRTPTPLPTSTGTLLPTSTKAPTLPPKKTPLPHTAMTPDQTYTFVIGGLLVLSGFGLYAYIGKSAKKSDFS